MEVNKVKIHIKGIDYIITTEDDVDYAKALGDELDRKINEFMSGNSHLSVTQAAVLSALEFLDMAKKSEASADNLRSQIQDYLEDSARARTDAEISRREAERLGKELAALRARENGAK
ncbi:MAG: cell division protein ZapA [Clostridiales bacterium]|nr:cell division protein ZapA [Clostridiales bacterium]